MGAAVIEVGQKLLAPTYDGEFIALNPGSGERLWALPFKPAGFEGPVGRNDSVFAAGADGSVYAVDAGTGRIRWQVALGAGTTTSIVASDANLYIGTGDGIVHRLDGHTGTRLASVKPDERLMPAGLPAVTQVGSLVVLLADKRMDYRALASIDLPLARVQWLREAGDRWSTSRVFVWRNAVLLGAPSGEIAAHCVQNGTIRWTHTVKGTVRAIGGSDDALYVGTREGALYALPAPAIRCG